MKSGKATKTTGITKKGAAAKSQTPKKISTAKISTPIVNGKLATKKAKRKYQNTDTATPSRQARKPVRKTKPDTYTNAIVEIEAAENAQQLLEAQMKMKEADFLADIANTASITRSSKNTGFSKVAHYKRMESDPEYAYKFKEAYQKGLDSLEDEVKRRAFTGYHEPVFYKGDVVGHVRKFSDTLAMFVLEAERREKFGRRMKVDKPDQNDLASYDDMTDAELDAEIEKLRKEVQP